MIFNIFIFTNLKMAQLYLQTNFRKFGDDTSYILLEKENLICLSVHTSNDFTKFILQWYEIIIFVKLFQDKNILICGDFNATINLDEEGKMFFIHSEKIVPIYETFKFNPVISNLILTTGKMRCLTSQFQKMMKEKFESIDGFIYFGENLEFFECKSYYYSSGNTKHEITHEDEIPPSEWLSDHSMIKFKTSDFTCYSLNLFGQSVNGDNCNIFEIFTESGFNKMKTNCEILDRFNLLLLEFSNIESKFGKHSKLIKDKFFSKKTKKYEFVDCLLPPNFEELNKSTELFLRLEENYNIQHRKYLNSEISEETEYAMAQIKEFQVKCLNDELLKPFFIDWYLEIENCEKIKIIDIINQIISEEDLSKKIIFCFQEVNESMVNLFKSQEIELNSKGFYIGEINPIIEDTIGLIIHN